MQLIAKNLLHFFQFIAVDEILVGVAASEEQNHLSNLFTNLLDLTSLRQECAERCEASAGTDHDQRRFAGDGQFELAATDVGKDFAALQDVAGAIEVVSQPVWVRLGAKMLGDGKEVVGCDTVYEFTVVVWKRRCGDDGGDRGFAR